MEWFLIAVRKYAVFNGRARRAEFWWYALIYFLLAIVAGFLDSIAGTYSEDIGWGLLGALVALGLALPTLAVGARRLHDTGRSGWWQLLNFVPLIGLIVLIVWWAQDGAPGSNAHGANPKEATPQDAGFRL